MRIIPAQEIQAAVEALFKEAVTRISPDVLARIHEAREQETGHAREILTQIIENERLARERNRPCCQDTGLAVVFLDIGTEVYIDGDVNAAVHAGVAHAYTDAYLRKSSLTALERKNTGDNTPPVLHVRFVPGAEVVISVAPKGFGSENMSRLVMLKPAEGKEGVLNSIVETAARGAANACPPIVLGVGIGGTMEAAALLAKRQLLRDIRESAQTEALRELEQEALACINALGIGPMGLGGNTTALAVCIGEMPTHLAGLPVAVNVQCHCARHATTTI
ncbi:fumarate hydratase [Christensenellaceae bacterium OttesenSCG-928-L17]|nr:fumarate hydratase [Christensenellaceae bacterium OttesenSCG-928-L17]